jgi:VanZ family protein
LHQILIMIKNNFRSAVIAIIIFIMSITESNNLKAPRFLDIPNLDKIVHFGMYFTFMFVLVYENRKKISKKTNVFLIGFIPFTYGILMECCQYLFTKTRTADMLDVLFNTLGILMAIGLWKYLKHIKIKRSD